jgi:hypothetical protein
MTMLEQFAALWGLKVVGERIIGVYGFICECDGKLWVWTNSHAPNGHEFFPIENWGDEAQGVFLMLGPIKSDW